MRYVYLIQSLDRPDQRYIGVTADVEKRLKEHNLGESIHTNKFKPWKIIATFGFENHQRADAFEQYLKHGSGHAFAKKHFW